MNAIIKQGGHQYNISVGDIIRVDQLSEPEGSKIKLQNILMAFDDKDSLLDKNCLLYTSPSPRDMRRYRMPSSA